MTVSIHSRLNHIQYRSRGEGPPLLLLHGFLGCGADFEHLFELSALERAYTVITPDFRGHGKSGNPDDRFSHRLCADDIEALLEHLGYEKVRAIGLSLGGNVLLHLATRRPSRIGSMVISGSPPYFPATARSMMANLDEASHPKVEREALKQRQALFRYAKEMAESTDDLSFTPPQLARIEAPVLMVNGDRDPLYPVELFVQMYRAIPCCRLWIVPGGGHAPVFEVKETFQRVALEALE